MTDNFSKSATQVLQNDNQELKFIFAKVQRLKQLNEKVLPLLEPTIKPYCQVANIIGSKLVLLVANGSAATQLRFQQPDIIRKFQKDADLQRIKEIQLKVIPSSPTPLSSQPRPRSMSFMSKETAMLVADMAQSLSDPELRNIMEKIAEKIKG